MENIYIWSAYKFFKFTKFKIWNKIYTQTWLAHQVPNQYWQFVWIAIFCWALGTVLATSLDHTFLDWTTLWGCLSELADLADGWVRRGGPIYWIIGMKVTNSGISPQLDRFGAQHVNWLQAWKVYLKPQCRVLFIKVSLEGEIIASKEHKFLEDISFHKVNST